MKEEKKDDLIANEDRKAEVKLSGVSLALDGKILVKTERSFSYVKVMRNSAKTF